jgi:large subunit ribosomal protein L18
MKSQLIKRVRLGRRIIRGRKKLYGTKLQPRFSVSRSNQNIYAQIIDDSTGRTLVAVSTQQKDVRESVGYGGNCKAASVVGRIIGLKAKEQGIEQVCFDRRGRRFHGRIKALAEAAREAGLKF